ncbi:MAG: hypothetical protein LC667_08355 [Thioalkalivibrio sp.]|nr:hypothetical protein [Thioalkalivibrio sp.]
MRVCRSLAPLPLLFATAVLAGCGGSDSTDVQPDSQVAPFVGDWEATEFSVTSSHNSEVSFDVTDGGAFTINIQPSGFYTAVLEFPQLPAPQVEMGQLSVVGSSITLRPQGLPATSSSYAFDGHDLLTLDGPTEFDFNDDGTLDPATARIVLKRVPAGS